MNRAQKWATAGYLAGFAGVTLALLLLALGIIYPLLWGLAGWIFIPSAVILLTSAIIIACTEVWDL